MGLVEESGSLKLAMAKADIERALEAGCKTAEEIVDFLHMVEEGWFFQEKLPVMRKLIEIRRKVNNARKRKKASQAVREGR
jgi:hypothetical protein